MTAQIHLTKFNRLAVAIGDVRRAWNCGWEGGDSNRSEEQVLSELEAVIRAAANGEYRSSQSDAIAALELAIALAEANRGAGCRADDGVLEALIRIGLERLKRMGL